MGVCVQETYPGNITDDDKAVITGRNQAVVGARQSGPNLSFRQCEWR